MKSNCTASRKTYNLLTDEILCDVEEMIIKLRRAMRVVSVQSFSQYKSGLEPLLKKCCAHWPRLRCAVSFTSDDRCEHMEEVDFALVSRAMQAEEDLVKMLHEFLGLLVLYRESKGLPPLSPNRPADSRSKSSLLSPPLTMQAPQDLSGSHPLSDLSTAVNSRHLSEVLMKVLMRATNQLHLSLQTLRIPTRWNL